MADTSSFVQFMAMEALLILFIYLAIAPVFSAVISTALPIIILVMSSADKIQFHWLAKRCVIIYA
jgi:hypothetical protein